MSQAGSFGNDITPPVDFVETLTGNSGGAVGPTAGNINVIGSGFVDVAGNPGTSTLTITIDGSGFAQDFPTDSGTATVAGDELNIFGGENINTEGSGNTVTINLNEVIRWSDTDASGSTGVIYLGATGGVGGTRFLHHANSSVYLGVSSGRFNEPLSTNNVGIGNGGVLSVATDVGSAVAIGQASQLDNQTSDNNVTVGQATLQRLISGDGNNTVIGTEAGQFLLTGAFNVLIGSGPAGSASAGEAYSTSESSNICISNPGVISDQNIIRFGQHGSGDNQQNRNFTAGIRGITPAVVGAQLVVIDSGHQLGGIANGTTGQLLTITTGANPLWGASSNGNFTFTSSTAGSSRTLTVTNTNNTNTGSHATFQSTSGGASGGDPRTTYTVSGAQSFTTGIDNSASDAFKLSASTALGTTDTFIMTTAGERTMPLQPAFLAQKNSDQNNITGDGTNATIDFASEIYDQNADYDGTNTFEAPVTGRYHFNVQIIIGGLTGSTSTNLSFTTSNRSYVLVRADPITAWGTNSVVIGGSIDADMDASDTINVHLIVAGIGSDTVDVITNTSTNYFSGYLIC